MNNCSEIFQITYQKNNIDICYNLCPERFIKSGNYLIIKNGDRNELIREGDFIIKTNNGIYYERYS